MKNELKAKITMFKIVNGFSFCKCICKDFKNYPDLIDRIFDPAKNRLAINEINCAKCHWAYHRTEKKCEWSRNPYVNIIREHEKHPVYIKNLAYPM